MSLYKKITTSDKLKQSSSDFNPDTKELSAQEKALLERIGANTKHRNRLVIWIMWLIPIWLLLALYIVSFLNIDNTIKNTLLVTTSANVLGLAYIVLKGLFSDKQQSTNI